MSDDSCDEMQLLVQADVDGELSPAEAARVQAHLARCPACAAVQASLLALSRRLRTERSARPAPAALAAKLRAMAPPPRPPPRRWIAPFGGGVALAACLALAVVWPGAPPPGDVDAVVADHIRALQPGHLMDVVSTDQHTVKPWFDGRLTFAPPVKDFQAQGFPLVGGRLDYAHGRAVGVLVYQRQLHVIDVFAWPDASRPNAPPASSRRDGYNVLQWQADGMALSAVSDLEAGELADFVTLWRAPG